MYSTIVNSKYSLSILQIFQKLMSLFPLCNSVGIPILSKAYCLLCSTFTLLVVRLGSDSLLPVIFYVFTSNHFLVLNFPPEMTTQFTPFRLQSIRSARLTKLVSRKCYIRKRSARHTKSGVK